MKIESFCTSMEKAHLVCDNLKTKFIQVYKFKFWKENSQ